MQKHRDRASRAYKRAQANASEWLRRCVGWAFAGACFVASNSPDISLPSALPDIPAIPCDVYPEADALQYDQWGSTTSGTSVSWGDENVHFRGEGTL